jgi:O-antigen/teichoic acid export membrane protein
MSAQDKLALGMSLFVLFFVIAFMVFPASTFREYFADLKRRKRGRIIKALLSGVFLLSLPYFYDELIGLDSKAVSVLLQVTMGACVYILLIDVAWFVYKKFGPPSQRPRRARR